MDGLEIILTYLVSEGGIFGVLFALAFIWIIFREKSLLTKDKENKEPAPEIAQIEDTLEYVESLNERVIFIQKKIEDLWEWHAVKDNDGVPIWYVRRTLEESINRLDKSVMVLKDQMQLSLHKLNDVLNTNDDLSDRLQRVNDERVSELKSLLEGYNKTITDLAFALEKIKLMLRPPN